MFAIQDGEMRSTCVILESGLSEFALCEFFMEANMYVFIVVRDLSRICKLCL